MTHHYSMAQIVELHGALEKIKDDTDNKRQSGRRVPPKSRSKKERLRSGSF